MAHDVADRDGSPLVLKRDDPGQAVAPARRFESQPPRQPTLFSHAFFAMMAVGIGTYLGKVHDTVNPDPIDAAGEDEPPHAPEEKPQPVTELTLIDQMSRFWEKFMEEYAEGNAAAPHILRHRGYVAAPETGEFQIPEAITQQPWRLMRVNPITDTIDFIVPRPSAVRLSFDAPSGGASGGGGASGSSNSSGRAAPASAGGTTGGATAGERASGPKQNDTARANRAPVSTGPLYLGSGLVNLSILLTWSDLAEAATDPDGDILTISNIRSTSGTIRAYGTDAWLFTPDRDMQGVVTFQYTLGDGKASVLGKGWLDLRPGGPEEIKGTDGDDVLIGTPRDDIIEAGAGNDVVYGREKSDVIFGGDGDDRLLGGDGNDVIHGGNGNDWIFGGLGDDVIFADAGDDLVFGEEGNDSIQGGTGNDRISGGAGNDRIFGDEGDDILSGDAGDDVLDGGDGADLLAGGAGADVTIGGTGNDRFLTGIQTVMRLSHDEQPAAPVEPDGNDVFEGGDGTDTYDASMTFSGVRIDLETGIATGVEIGTDRLVSVESAAGGMGNDVILASDAVNIMSGGDGADIFVFGQTSHLSNSLHGRDLIRDFEIGDKIDLSRLGRELGRLEFHDGDTLVTELDNQDHRTLIKLFKEMSDSGDELQVVQFLANIDGDHTYELVVISATDLNGSDFILTATELPDMAGFAI